MRRFLDSQSESFPPRAILTDDPMRAKMLVAHHLDNASLVSEQRGMVGYTGVYESNPLGVFSVGYGEAAALVYLSELVRGGVRKVAFLGECVSSDPVLKLRDVILAASADGARGPVSADGVLLETAVAAAARLGIPVQCLPVVTNDLFPLDGRTQDGQAVDYSANALYWYAAQTRIAAVSILTVSENTASHQSVEPAERQSRFHSAAQLAFATIATIASPQK